MKFEKIDPPRQFQVAGAGLTLTLSDCARVTLSENEQITFLTEEGGEYDVTRKSWGFYATPSTNGRLLAHGLRTALVSNKIGRLFVVLVEIGKEDEFWAYLDADKQLFITWLDKDSSVERLLKALNK